MLAKLKLHYKKIIVGLFAAALLGVAVFDTYPTYFKKTVTLSPQECSQVAIIVAAQAYRKQQPDKPMPPSAKAELKNATRLAKRVATYIIQKNPEALDMPPYFLYQNIFESCVAVEGVAELK